MPSLENLQSHTLKVLRNEVKKTNMKKWSKLKKGELITMMMMPEHRANFHHLSPHKVIVKPEPPKKKVIIRKKKVEPKKKVIIRNIPKEVIKGNSIETEQEFIKNWKDHDKTLQTPENYTNEQYKKFYKLYLEKENVKPKKKVIIRKPKEVKKKVIIRKEKVAPKKKVIIRSTKDVKLKTVTAGDIAELGRSKVIKKKTIIKKVKPTMRRLVVMDEEDVPRKKKIIIKKK